MYDSCISRGRFFGLIFWSQQVDLYTSNYGICIDKKSVYRKDLANLGIIKVGYLIADNNLFLHEDPSVTISPEQRFLYYGSCSLSPIGLENNY